MDVYISNIYVAFAKISGSEAVGYRELYGDDLSS